MKRGTPYQPIGNPQAGHRPSNRSWIMKATAASTIVFLAWVLLAPSLTRPGPQAAQAPPAQERPLAATSSDATARLAGAAGQPAAKAADLLQAKPAQPLEPEVQPPKPAEPLLAEPLLAEPAEPLPAKAAVQPDEPAWATASTRTSLIGSTPQDWMHLNSWPTTAEAMNNLTYQEWEQVSWKPSLLSHVQPAGDYVSFGKLKPWFGDVFPSSNLKEALAARSYKKELIIFSFNRATALEAVNFVFNLRDLGYDHWLALTDDSTMCEVMRTAFPNGGCGYSSLAEAFPGIRIRPKDGVEFKQLYLWATVARAVRLGYNVLSVDIDIITHYDLYSFFKSEPYANMTLIWQNDGYPKVNSGAVYFQNAHPNGLAAYAVVEEVLRPLRYIDSPDWHLAKEPFKAFGGRMGEFLDQVSWEQDLWTSVVEGAMRGMPWLTDIAWPGRTWPERKHEYSGIDWELPADWQERLNATTEWYWYFEAPVPRPSAAEVDAAGGPIYPPVVKGGFVDKFKALLEEESGPLFAEPYDAAGSSGGAELAPAERVGMFMDFLFDSFDGFRKGRWWRRQPPACVACHAVTVNGGKQMRINSWKSLGWWRWRVDHIVRGALGQSGVLTASSSRHPVPPLLVMAPGTVDMTIANESDWQRFNMHFVAIAHLMGRIPVMPLLSCRSPFLGPDGHTFFHNITFDYNRHGVLPADDEVYPEAAEMCYIWDYGKDGCVQEVTFHWDFLRQAELLKQAPVPAANNTAFYDDWAGGALVRQPFGLEPVDVTAVRELAVRFPVDSVPIAYLGRPVRMVHVDPATLKAMTDPDYYYGWDQSAAQRQVCTAYMIGVNDKARYRELFLQQ